MYDLERAYQYQLDTASSKTITNVHRDKYDRIVGEHEGRPVTWTYSVNLWYHQDDNSYIFGSVIETREGRP